MVSTLQIDWRDIVVITSYLVFVLAIGLWAICTSNKNSVSGYFLASKDVTWFPIGASLFSSNIGAGSFIGLSGTAAAAGLAVASYELIGGICLLLMAWIFVPVYRSSQCQTMPGYLRQRFGGQRLQIYLSVQALLVAIFTNISAEIFAGALLIQVSLGWNLYVSILALLVITGLFTILGGLKAVIYTDTIQTVIMLCGAVYLMVVSITELEGGLSSGGNGTMSSGWYDQLQHLYLTSVPNTTLLTTSTKTNVTPAELAEFQHDTSGGCGGVPDEREAFHMIRSAQSSNLPWPGVIFGVTILSAGYFCTNQVLVQRALAARSMNHVKGGSLLAGYLKLTPLILMVLPGMISRILYTDEVACTDPEICDRVCQNSVGCSNLAYPYLVYHLMPPGARGLMLAVMMSALVSSLTSTFNSMSTIFTLDLWTKIRAQASEREQLIVGRVCTVVLIGISVAWVPMIQVSQSGQLFLYIQSVLSYLQPPVMACFTLAVLWRSCNEQGAFWGVLTGIIIGIIRMVLDFVYSAADTPSGSRVCGVSTVPPDLDTPSAPQLPAVVSDVHFLHFTCLLYGICILVTIAVSLITRSEEPQQLSGLTLLTLKSDKDVHGPSGAPVPTTDLAKTTGTPQNEENQSTIYVSSQVAISNSSYWSSHVLDFNAIILISFLVFVIGFLN